MGPGEHRSGGRAAGRDRVGTDSTGHGLALVLPDRFEIGQLANNMVMDLGDDIVEEQSFLGIKVKVVLPMGEQNLFNLISGLLFDGPPVMANVWGLGNIQVTTVRAEAEKMMGISIDPQMFGKYGDSSTDIYSQIVADAALPVVSQDTRKWHCDYGVSQVANVEVAGPDATCADKTYTTTKVISIFPYRTETVTHTATGTVKVKSGQYIADVNATKRAEALKVAEYLTGHTYDATQPVILPPLTGPKGQSVIKGDGINVALSMRGGRAYAETGNDLAVALAGADHGQVSEAYAKYAIAIAANMDTEDIRFTWFGQDVDFSSLLPLLTSDMAAGMEGADEMAPMLGMIGDLNGTIPSLKEVYCFGVDARATAEGLGSCTNFLGTFDTYKDLRPLSNGSADFTGDSVSRQEQYGLTDLSSLAFGNNALLTSLAPLLSGGDMGDIMSNPVIGNMLVALISEEKRLKLTNDFIRYTKNVETVFAKEPVLDANGDPVLTQERDSDGSLLWKDANGTRYTRADIDADDALDVDDLEPSMVPVLKNKVTPRMVGVTEDAWETYMSDEPVLVDAKDSNGEQIWVDAAGNVVDAGTDGAVKKQVQQVDADGKPVFKEKTRYFTRPAMVEQRDADGNVVYRDYRDGDANAVWFGADGAQITVADGDDAPAGAVRKTPVMVQKLEQATDHRGELLWDPVVEKSVTAHWLTSDYGLREPLVIEWLGHQVVFFPAVEVNGTYRPNLIGLPEITRITGDAGAGLLPKISLVQWDNAFGLGTVGLDKPFDPFYTLREWSRTVTLHNDLKQIDELTGLSAGVREFVAPVTDLFGKLAPQQPTTPGDPGDPAEGGDPVDGGDPAEGADPADDIALGEAGEAGAAGAGPNALRSSVPDQAPAAVAPAPAAPALETPALETPDPAPVPTPETGPAPASDPAPAEAPVAVGGLDLE